MKNNLPLSFPLASLLCVILITYSTVRPRQYSTFAFFFLPLDQVIDWRTINYSDIALSSKYNSLICLYLMHHKSNIFCFYILAFISPSHCSN